ncbi:MAG TPA: alpha/beta hydrolase [Armatimonadota bacterium]|nr:alpha/beta hydrolase [Armatimonadota bacterium]
MTVAVSSELLLWPQGAPGALGNDESDIPAITIHLPEPEKATGSAVVVFPGGGYQHLANDHEGRQIAEWFNARGVAAFVLRYRLGPRYHHPIELGDAQRAIRTVRANAAEWGIDPQRIGIMGFSAGGHLASTASTHFDAGNTAAVDPIERVSCRPDFAVLCYPVVTFMPPYNHVGSRANLLGENPSDELVEYLSNDRQVTADTPPTFLFHTTDDPVVPVENSLLYFGALRKAGVPAEMHIYAHGPHGVGLLLNDPVLGTWSNHLEVWLRESGILTKKLV